MRAHRFARPRTTDGVAPLKTLHDAGLLDREQRGKWAYYSLNRAAMTKLTAVADLKGACC